MSQSIFKAPEGQPAALPSMAETGSRAEEINRALEKGIEAARATAQASQEKAREARAAVGSVEEASRAGITSAREERARQFAAQRRAGGTLAQSLGISGTGAITSATDEARARSQAAMDVAQARLGAAAVEEQAAAAQEQALATEAGAIAEKQAIASGPQAELRSYMFEMQNSIAAAEGRANKASAAAGYLVTLDPAGPEYQALAEATVLSALRSVGVRAGVDTIRALVERQGFTYEEILDGLATHPAKGMEQKKFVSWLFQKRNGLTVKQGNSVADSFNSLYDLAG